MTEVRSERKELMQPSGCGWTKDRPTKKGYYWHKFSDGRILVLEWQPEYEWAWEHGNSEPLYLWGNDVSDGLDAGWWWPEEITFNHNK